MFAAIGLILGVLLPVYGKEFVERSDFCIETEPTLLIDIGRHVVIPSEKQIKCLITATTLTVKEKVGQFKKISFCNTISVEQIKVHITLTMCSKRM